MSLTAMQNNFIWLFVTDCDFDVVRTAQQMAILPTEAMRWFLDPGFQKALGKAQRMRFTLLGIHPYRTLTELSAIAYSNINDIVSIDEAGRYIVKSFDDIAPRALLAVKSIKLKRTTKGGREEPVFEDVVEIVLHDKVKALIELARMQGVEDLDEIKANAQADQGPRKVAGLLVTPPREAIDYDPLT